MKTIADVLAPPRSRGYQIAVDLLLVLCGSVLVAVCAKIQFPMVPVPFTMQPFAVLLVGATLGRRRGAAAMGAYLLEGALGVPVFAGPVAGPAYFAGPTVGYLLGFPVAAFCVGLLAERGWDRRLVTAVPAMALGQMVILGLGFAWMTAHLGLKAAYSAGVAPFLLADCLKILLAATALPAAWRLVRWIQRPFLRA